MNLAPRRAGRTLDGVFEEWRTKTPEAVAVSCGGQRLSYAELGLRASRVADALVRRGAGPDTLIGLYHERTVDLIAALLGILRSGAAYVPIDPRMPLDRARFIAKDAGLRTVIGSASLIGAWGDSDARLLDARDPDGWPADARPRRAVVPRGRSPLAYVLYTSGSTGRPKGVLCEHANIMTFLDGFETVVPSRRPLVGSSLCSVGFDVSIWEIFSVLCSGGRLELLPDQIASDPESLARAICDLGVTSAYLPPGILDDLAGRLQGRSLRLDRILVGVEPIPQRVLQRYRELGPEMCIVNGYGPTETSVCATLFAFSRAQEPDRPVPIGFPIPGYGVRIVDSRLREVSAGEVGEILITGPGVARGYLNAPSLTKARFLPAARRRVSGGRTYRSGDMGRLLPSGAVEFVGRIDRQVKIRGFRVELGEVEAALAAIQGVRRSAVLATNGAHGRRLVAWVEAADGFSVPAARARLAELLPRYMVPGRIVKMRRLPSTRNGKVDRDALEKTFRESRVPAAHGPQPEGDTETHVCALFREILDTDAVGAHDDFFALGGDSLSALRIAAGLSLTLGQIMKNPTVAGLVELLRERDRPDRPIPPAPERPIELSFSQEGLWIMSEFDRASAAFTLPIMIRLKGSCRLETLEAALQEAIDRQSAMRTRIAVTDGRAYQSVEPQRVDLKDVLAADEALVLSSAQKLARQPIPLDGRLWRAQVYRLGPREHVLLLAVHHIVFDGWSLPVFLRELAGAYRSAVNARALPAALSSLGLSDFADWQRRTAPEWEESREFWRRRLTPFPQPVELPLDHPRPARRGDAGAEFRMRVDPALTARLKRTAAEGGTTLFQAVVAAVQIFVARYSRLSDIVVCVPLAQRGVADLHDRVGYFVNLLPLRMAVPEREKFSDFLRTFSAEFRDAIAHGDYPFELMMAEAGGRRGLEPSSLARVVVAQEVEPSAFRASGLSFRSEAVPSATAPYELALFVAEEGRELALRWNYSTALFDPATIERWAASFETVVRSIAERPDVALGDVDLLSREERRQLTHRWNATRTEYPAEKALGDLLDEQVLAWPERTAVSDGRVQLTYRELGVKADSVAGALRRRGVGRDVPVLVVGDKSAGTIVLIAGVVKAGGAYAPVDCATPPGRLEAIAAETGARLLLVPTEEIAAEIPGCERLTLSQLEGGPPASAAARPDDLANVMMTSGSTGRPKVVGIPHRAVVRLVRNTDYARFDESDRFLQIANLSFDAATLEIWGALLNGGSIHMVPQSVISEPSSLCAVIKDLGITSGFFTVSLFSRLIETDPEALRQVRNLIVGGENVPEALFARAAAVMDFRHLVNGYGPTENTTFSCCHRLSEPPVAGRPIPIGRPIANSTAYVLDAQSRPVPMGVIGEIFVGGDGLARGYLNDPELNERKFVANPFSGVSGARLYRTGDLGRVLPDGNIVYVGRDDDQVKIRGFRVELGEIESLMTRFGGGGRSVVLAPELPEGRRLVAFHESAVEGVSTRLMDSLRSVLPSQMVPSRLIALSAFPMTSNGKVDKARLLRISQENRPADTAAPMTATEERIARLWRELLQLDSVSREDNFFDMGGNSILIMMLRHRIQKEFGVDLTPVQLLEHSTVARLAGLISDGAVDEAEALRRRAAERIRRMERRRS